MESYPAGYERVDERHAEKRHDLRGQFIYGSLFELTNSQGDKARYIATIKLDDSNLDEHARFKDISIKAADDAGLSFLPSDKDGRAHTDLTPNKANGNLPPASSTANTIQQLIDFVRAADQPGRIRRTGKGGARLHHRRRRDHHGRHDQCVAQPHHPQWRESR